MAILNPERIEPVNPAFKEPPVDFFSSPAKEEKYDAVAEFLKLDMINQRKALLDPEIGYAPFKDLSAKNQLRFLNEINEDTSMIADLFRKGEIPEGTPEYTRAQKVYLKLKPYIEPTVEAGAATGGAILGVPAFPPFGSIVGGGLGYGMARKLFDMVDVLMGVDESGTFTEELAESGKDVIVGTTFEAGGRAVSPVIKGLKNVVTKPARKAADKLLLTEKGAEKRALEIFKQESKGTVLTQPQIDENVRLAKELEIKIRKFDPEFKFTQGQRTNDASIINLERLLSKKEGQDMSQSTREYANEVLRQYFNQKVASTGTIEDYVQYIERMKKELEASTKQAVRAVEAETLRLNRYLEPQTFGTNIHKNLSKGKSELRKKATLLYNKIPDLKLDTTTLSQDIQDFIKKEEGLTFVRGRTKEIIKKINTKMIAKEGSVSINPATGEKTITDPKLKPIGYQVLRKLTSDAKELYRDAMSGIKPDLKDARQLFEVVGYLEDAMKQMEKVNPKAAALYDKATRFYADKLVPTYKQGTVADVLQKGARGEETKIAKANIAEAFDSLDGIDEFLRAVGDNKVARSAMRDYYAYSFMNSNAIDANGKVVAKNAISWLRRNALKLKKLGIYEEFNSVQKAQIKVDELLKYRDVFNQSIAGRVLEADVKNMISNAFRNSKNLSRTAQELLDLAKDNDAAKRGIKKAFAEFLIINAETTKPKFFQTGDEESFRESVAAFERIYAKYASAIRVMYKNEPIKIRALNDVRKSLQIIERTTKSPIAGQSDTAELIFGEKRLLISKGVKGGAGGVRPGALYPLIFMERAIEKWGRQKVEKYLLRALFDPDYALAMKATVLEGKKDLSKAANVKLLDRLMTTALMLSFRGNEEERQPTARGINPPVK